MKQSLFNVLLIFSIAAFLGCSSGQEQAAWEECKSANTIECYEKYLSDFPEGKHVKEAGEKMEGIYYDQAASDEKILLEVFDKYAVQFSDGKYWEKFEDLIYNYVLSKNTADAFEDYLQRFPTGRYTGEFETVLFNSVMKGGSRFTVEDYVQRYPNGVHLADLEKMLFDSVQILRNFQAVERYTRLFPEGTYIDAVEELSETIYYENVLTVNQAGEFRFFMEKYPESERIKRIKFETSPEKTNLRIADRRGRELATLETPGSFKGIEGTTIVLKFRKPNYKPDSITYIVKADTLQVFTHEMRTDATVLSFDKFESTSDWELSGNNINFVSGNNGWLAASTAERQYQHLRTFPIDFSNDFLLEMQFRFTGQPNNFKSYIGFLWGSPQSFRYFFCTQEGTFNFGEQEAKNLSGDNPNGYSKWNMFSGTQDAWPTTSAFNKNGVNKLIVERKGNTMVYSINELNLHQENIFRSPAGRTVGIGIGNAQTLIDYIKIIQ